MAAPQRARTFPYPAEPNPLTRRSASRDAPLADRLEQPGPLVASHRERRDGCANRRARGRAESGTGPHHRGGPRSVTGHGSGGTSLQMIADAIGVTKAAVYHQYRTKDEIILAAAEDELRSSER